MFNALLKIPMQAFILLLGALLFVFYQFSPAPVFFDRTTWQQHVEGPGGERLRALEDRYAEAGVVKRAAIQQWVSDSESGDPARISAAREAAKAAHVQSEAIRAEAKATLRVLDPSVKTKDSDYVFITFVLEQLPRGVIGLLIAVIFAAALSSVAAELSALGSTTVVDLYGTLRRGQGGAAPSVLASKLCTALWGLVAVGFALFARVVENLIEAVNILGSLFYGVILGLFLVAFFLRRVGGHAVFTAAILAELAVLTAFFVFDRVGYLWYNLIGCTLCVVFSLVLQALLPSRPQSTLEAAAR
jgi:Na+(H+)/acetate symporter ActP